jgi:DNA-binding response OmpR family regulator
MADKTILLIEDDREIATTIQGVLQAAGYPVLVASNGIDGRRIIDNEHPALVITDMMMPKMGGFPVLEYLRNLPSPPRVIMITANEGGRHKAYAEMLGVDEYLRKPFAMDVLLEAIERVIGSGEDRGSNNPGPGPGPGQNSGAARMKRPAPRRTPQ